MRSLTLIILLSVCVLISCGTATHEGNMPPAADDTQSILTKDDAEQRAATYLRMKEAAWGKPIEVLEGDGGVYVLRYNTPKGELQLLGERVIIIDQATGAVAFRPRR